MSASSKQPAGTGRALIVHGGAGDIPAALRAGHLAGVRAAAAAGWAVLLGGGSALDAVEAAVRLMEDDPVFDAGRGSFLTQAGTVELDAGVMLGRTRQLGAVAGVQYVAHPITLARRVLESGRFGMLVGAGAQQFAVESGMGLVDEATLIDPREQAQWDALRLLPDFNPRQAANATLPSDTVGAVARDQAGQIAVGTSTGGSLFKHPGRVGNSPLVGCGFYATEAGGASSTGDGEAIQRVGLARTAVERLAAPRHRAPAAAAADALATLTALGATGGVILLDAAGRPGWAFTTPHMAHAWVDADGTIQAGIMRET